MAKIAADQIEKYGGPITLSHATGSGQFDPVTRRTTPAVVKYTGKGVSQKVGAGEVNGTSIQTGDRRLIVAAMAIPFVPSPNDSVVADGATWNVSHVATESAQGVAVTHELLIRK
ncbi:hypothetical protein [Chromobacterium amazonense]|uniref:hypothetical protein n=1 Tax=Chromobacterium amazonense TaxID=1382803 RepID=UPI0021B74FB4|nr:hypothetical protein [Chromobacterium amazonense]MDE1711831.1 hypothetical protein [Chromobacterium amazonense]